MSKKLSGKLAKSLVQKFEEDSYEDDFEDFDYADDDDDETLVTPTVSLSSTAVSVTPESDSAGDNVNTKSFDSELLSSLQSEYDYDAEEDTISSRNYDFRLFHQVLEEVVIPKQKRYKNGTRSSLTFSNQRVREIERHNQLLLSKIMKNGPSGDAATKRHNSACINQRATIQTNAEVNRKKKQQKIEYENQLLKRKLDKIAARRQMP